MFYLFIHNYFFHNIIVKISKIIKFSFSARFSLGRLLIEYNVSEYTKFLRLKGAKILAKIKFNSLMYIINEFYRSRIFGVIGCKFIFVPTSI